MKQNGNNLFLQQTGVEVPIICGPMFPCSNPELVAAASGFVPAGAGKNRVNGARGHVDDRRGSRPAGALEGEPLEGR